MDEFVIGDTEVALLVEEYRALRAEVAGSLQAQHAVLSYGVAALALFVVALANIWDKSAAISALGLMFGVPIGIGLVLAIWSTEMGRMKRAGAYMAGYLEPRIAAASNLDNPLVYERWLANEIPEERSWTKPRSLRRGYGIFLLSLTLLTLASFYVGLLRFGTAAAEARHCAAAGAAIASNECGRGGTSVTTTTVGSSSTGHSGAVGPTYRPSWYLRDWHRTWPTSLERIRRGWEPETATVIVLLVPIGLGLVTLFGHMRRFKKADLPFPRNTAKRDE